MKAAWFTVIIRIIVSLALIFSIQAEDATRFLSSVGAIHEPGVYGDGKCLNGVILAGDAKQADVIVEVDGIRFGGLAVPDRPAMRVLIKVTTMVSVNKDGQVTTREVDGYLQDARDGKPGLVADFSMADNALKLNAGSIGKLILLRSVQYN